MKKRVLIADASDSCAISFIEEWHHRYEITALTHHADCLHKLAKAERLCVISYDDDSFLDLVEDSEVIILCSHALFDAGERSELSLVLKFFHSLICKASELHKTLLFISTGSVYAKSLVPVDEESAISLNNPRAEVSARIEEYIKELCVYCNRAVIRAATPYGPHRSAFALGLFKAVTLLSLLPMPHPQLSKAHLFPMVHTSSVAACLDFFIRYFDSHDGYYLVNLANPKVDNFSDVINTLSKTLNLYVYEASFLNPHPRIIYQLFYPPAKFSHRMLGFLFDTLWKNIQRLYALSSCPGFEVDNVLESSSMALLNTSKLRSMGFEISYRSFSEDIPDLYKSYKMQQWLPELKSPPFKKFGVKLEYEQFWDGFVYKTENSNKIFDAKLRVKTSFPLIPAPLNGLSSLKGELEISSMEGKFQCTGVKNLNAFSRLNEFEEVSLFFEDGNERYTLKPTQHYEGYPCYKVQIEEPGGKVVYIGQLGLRTGFLDFVRQLSSLRICQSLD